jgi:hypothetical protein
MMNAHRQASSFIILFYKEVKVPELKKDPGESKPMDKKAQFGHIEAHV